MMTPSQDCIDLVAQFEGCKLTAYLCPAGVLTIGYGHTGPDVKPGQTITKERARQLLAADLAKFAHGVNELCNGWRITQGMFDALVSFAYNLGLGALAGSTLMRLLRAGDVKGAADQFSRWNKAAGKVLPGLVKRRAAERDLFLKGIPL